MKRTLQIIFIIFNLLALTSVAAPKNAKDILKKVKGKYDKIQSLKADFKQVFLWELAGETQTINGTIYLTSGNNFRIETDNQIIVTDGSNVWTYSKGNGQVIIDLLTKSEDNTLPKDLLFKYSEDYKPHYVGEEKIDGKKTYVLNLIPKDEDTLITSMKIWVDADDWFTLKIEQVDINDNVNTYHMSNIQENIPLDAALFSFEIPPDSEVVDLREN